MENKEIFLKSLKEYIEINKMIEIVYCYPRRNLDLDITNEKYQQMFNKALELYQDILKLINLFEKIIINNIDIVNDYLNCDEFSEYKRYINLIIRKKDHMLEDDEFKAKYVKKVEEIKSKYQTLFNNGFEIKNIQIEGKKVDINRKNYNELMLDKNQSNRKIVFDAYTKEYENCNEVLASIFIEKIKTDLELAIKENYPTLLSKKLYELELNDKIVENLIEQVNKYLYVMHKYLKLKKEVLGLETMHFYDATQSLCSIPQVKYDILEGIDIVKNSLSPLGKNYIEIIDKMFKEGWIDIYPKDNKRSNSYTCMSYVGVPYILMNYTNDLNSVRTLAHEIGHSINAYYAKINNQFQNFEISYFLTEIASKVNEMLFNHYMINNCKTEEEKIYILNNIISSLGNSLFGQAMLTEFEHQINQKNQLQEELNSNIVNNIYLELSKKYNGDSIVYDENTKYGWSKTQHFFIQDSYYLYQYSIGAAISYNISKRIIDDEPQIVDKYIKFLSIGNSLSIKESLAYLDIDLEKDDYIGQVISLLDDSINQLSKIKRIKK